MKLLLKIMVLSVLGVTIAPGCNKDELKNLNINPQARNTIDLNFLFTSAQLGAASGGSAGDNRYVDWRTNIRMCSYAIQQLASAGGEPGDKYTDDFETANAPFEFIYGDQLKNLGEILRQTDAGGFAEGQYKNMRQAARIIKAFLFSRVTDYYNRVPYFETLQAADKIFFPHYDSQKAIYTELLKELDEATAAFGAPEEGDGFPEGDIYYDGDIAKWKRWGYSLMLRLAMRVSNVDPDMANTYVAKAVAGGVFVDNEDNTIVPMAEGPSLWTNQNGISRAFIPGDGGQSTIMSKTFIDFLKGPDASTTADDDPRLMILTGGIGVWTPTEFTPRTTNPLDMKGMPNGKNQSMLETIEGVKPLNLDSTYSKINPLFLDRDDPYMLMNYGEVELLLAEAAQRSIGGLSPADAAGHYEAGVRASMGMLSIYDPSFTVTTAAADTYLATYPYDVTKPGLQMIYDQLWVNHFLNWWEAWSDWRRTGYPTLTAVNFPGNVTGGTIPQRLKYPNAEVAGNPNFTDKELSMNNYTTKVWWAGGPE